MSIEPGIAHLIAGDAEPAPGALVDWTAYQQCGICRAPIGSPCTAKFAAVRDGRPDGGPHTLSVAHGFRKRRAGR